MTLVGKNIKAKRENLGMTQEELASLMGYKSKSTINKIETGINDITLPKVEAFAKKLKTSASVLMGWESDYEFTDMVDKNQPQTIAAHFDGKEYTEDELAEIKQFAEFVKNKRK